MKLFINLQHSFLESLISIEAIPLDVKPPREFDNGHIWKLNRTVYGLKDASRAWYLRVKEELIQLGAQISHYDEALFLWYENSELVGVMSTHVDDFFWSGDSKFEMKVIQNLKQKFKISKEESLSFKYLGLDLSQQNAEINISQNDYIESVESIKLSINQKLEKDDSLTSTELRDLRALLGKLNWIARQTRPDLTFDICSVSVNIKKATVKDILYANKIVQKLHNDNINIIMRS